MTNAFHASMFLINIKGMIIHVYNNKNYASESGKYYIFSDSHITVLELNLINVVSTSYPGVFGKRLSDHKIRGERGKEERGGE